MRRTGRPRPAAARGMIAGAAVCAALGLAACGSAVASGGAHGHGTAAGTAGGVCAHLTSLDKVVITRRPGMMTSYMRDFIPLGEVVTNGGAVRGLAGVLCALPPMPSGAISCPADFGLSVSLAFARHGQAFRPVVIDISGCRTVTGLGKPRWWARTPRVWQELRHAMESGHLLLPLRAHGTAQS